MKYLVLVLLLGLVLAGPVSAKAVSTVPGLTQVIRAPSVIYCTDTPATTPADMGRLSVVSTPSGFGVELDGAVWQETSCIDMQYGGKLCVPYFYTTPASGNVTTGSHAIAIKADGYQNYVGTVNICSQTYSYVAVTLVPVTATTTTVPVTTIVTAATTTPTGTGTTAIPTGTVTSGTTTAAASPTDTGTTIAVTGSATAVIASPTTGAAAGSGTQTQAPNTGSLSVTTTPAGALVFIDGTQVGVSPVTVPGLSPGAHTILMKLDGYADLTATVTITAGQTQVYTTGLSPRAAAAPATTAGAAGGTTPGFEAVPGIIAIGAILAVRSVGRK
jgi:hypothetical protein